MPARTLLFTAALTILLAGAARAQFNVRSVSADTGTFGVIDNMDEAEVLLGSPVAAGQLYPVINFAGGGGGADFGGDVPFPGIAGDGSNFAIEALGTLTVNTPGNYVFRVNSDDGFRLRTGVNLDGTGGLVLMEFFGARGPANTDSGSLALPAGFSTRGRLTFFEAFGGDELEFSYSRDGGAFQLVGSTADITITGLPEPSSTGFLVLGVAGLITRRRR